MRARGAWAARGVARAALALFVSAAGSIGCAGSFAPAGQSSQPGAGSGQIDLTSPGGARWPVLEQAQAAPELSDADVEQLATRLPKERVPRVPASSPSKGPSDAKVTLQLWSDFECPFCVRVAPALARVEERYRGRVRLVFRNYPLPSHAAARPAARAALEALNQGGSPKFWQLHDWLYSRAADLSEPGLMRAAAALGLDADKVRAASRDARYDALIDADVAAGDAAGIEGTPAVLINDYYMMGARQGAEYSLVVERALREAG